MPIELLITDSSYPRLLAVWCMSETSSELLDLADLNDAERLQWKSIRLEKRKREWLGQRILCKRFVPGSTVAYLASGKPVIPGGPHISFSHHGHYAAIMIAEVPCGLDLQAPDTKLMALRSRFMHADELAQMPDDPDQQLTWLTLAWTAKEAIFKCFGEHVHFAGHIRMRSYSAEAVDLQAGYHSVHGEQIFMLAVMKLGDTILTFTPPIQH
ncbi:MAG: 4'-phosphopantetheinyl transferase family protein [Flavobacteriales bacterium]